MKELKQRLHLRESTTSAIVEMKCHVLDLGILRSPRPQLIGMDKMYVKTRPAKFIVEAFNTASLHGVNQIVAPRRHTCERFLFSLIIIGALISLILISMDSWRRYRHEATMLVLDNNFRKFEISKPSITICPINIVDENKFPEVFKRYNITDTPEIRKFFLTLANATSYRSIVIQQQQQQEKQINTDFTSIPAELWLQLLVELRSNVEVESLYSSEQQYHWVSTERGLCIMLASSISRDISIDNWLPSVSKISSSSRKKEENVKKSFFNIHNYGVIGSINCKTHDFWMSIHHPDTVIDHTTNGLLIHKTSLNSLTLGIVEVSSSASASQLSVGQRNCKLPTDQGLDMWPLYTQQMCILECRFKFMIQVCSCIPHFAKPMKGVPTCNVRQLLCIANHEKEVVQLESSKLKSCGCLPDCNEAIYVQKEYTSFALKDGSPPDAIINLHLDFPQVKYIRDEFFSFTDFLASIGGAAGLFLGASFLSVCEILYFASLRLLIYLIEEKRKDRWIKEILRGYRK